MQAYTAHLALPSRFISILNSIRNWLFSSPLKVKMLTSSWVYLSTLLYRGRNPGSEVVKVQL